VKRTHARGSSTSIGRAARGTTRARARILDHTYHGRVVARRRVGGRDFDEAALNAAVCGAHGIPVALVTGDRAACARARELLGDIETVAVEHAITRYAARCLAPSVARERIRDAARRAVGRAKDLRPFSPPRRTAWRSTS
jgi:D-amino peptidase